MQRILAGGLLALLIAIGLTIAAAPVAYAQANCNVSSPQQAAMAGVYVSPEARMRVEIDQCGGSYVQWENSYGTHGAAYSTVGHLVGGGIVAEGMLADPISGTWLDASRRIGFKPAEPGHIQAITSGVYDETFRVYRLKKIA